MKEKLLTTALIISILISALIGAGSAYSYNKLLQTSHRTTYTLKEELAAYDRIVEMADNNVVDASVIKRAFTSQKKSRIAAHELMYKSKKILHSVIMALIFMAILQLNLLYTRLKKMP